MKCKKELAKYDELLRRTSRILHRKSRAGLMQKFRYARDKVAETIGTKP